MAKTVILNWSRAPKRCDLLTDKFLKGATHPFSLALAFTQIMLRQKWPHRLLVMSFSSYAVCCIS
jgi:hypothetical protein